MSPDNTDDGELETDEDTVARARANASTLPRRQSSRRREIAEIPDITPTVIAEMGLSPPNINETLSGKYQCYTCTCPPTPFHEYSAVFLLSHLPSIPSVSSLSPPPVSSSSSAASPSRHPPYQRPPGPVPPPSSPPPSRPPYRPPSLYRTRTGYLSSTCVSTKCGSPETFVRIIDVIR